MNKTQLNALIVKAAPMLQSDLKNYSAFGILTAIATVESSFGTNNKPRFEKAYAPMGKWCVGEQKDRFARWGSHAACSYGSFQIMYPTACELGFDNNPYNRSPDLLSEDEIGIHYVIEYIKKRIISRGVNQLEDFPDAFNSGSARDSIIPVSYIRDFMIAYNAVNKTEYI